MAITGKAVEKVKHDSDRDHFMSPEQAKAYGLIDEVFAGNSESLISMTQAAGGTLPSAKEAAGGGQGREVATGTSWERRRNSERRV